MSGGISLTVPFPKPAMWTEMGLLGENFEYMAADSTVALTSGTTRFAMLPLSSGQTVSNLYLAVNTVSNTVTTIKVGIYDTNGNRLAASANITTALDAQGITSALPLTTPYTAETTDMYLASILSVASTAGTLLGAVGSTGKATTAFKIGGTEAGQTDLDATAAISAATAVYWVGWS